MTYWVIQIVRGNYYAMGYKTYSAAEKRFNLVQGGEVYLHKSFLTDARQAVDEFKSQQASGR
jgi:hypothetical protein